MIAAVNCCLVLLAAFNILLEQVELFQGKRKNKIHQNLFFSFQIKPLNKKYVFQLFCFFISLTLNTFLG